MRIEKLKQTFEIDATLIHFPLHPETPMEGRAMAELYAGRNVDPEAMYARMKGLMDTEGLPYGRRTHTYNSRLAQELGKWADTQPGGEALHDALYRAYFVDARNIGDPADLQALAVEAGLEEGDVADVLAGDTYRDRVLGSTAQAQSIGVSFTGGGGPGGGRGSGLSEDVADFVGSGKGRQIRAAIGAGPAGCGRDSAGH